MIEEILKKHISNVNSFVDENGHNRFMDCVKELENLHDEIKRDALKAHEYNIQLPNGSTIETEYIIDGGVATASNYDRIRREAVEGFAKWYGKQEISVVSGTTWVDTGAGTRVIFKNGVRLFDQDISQLVEAYLTQQSLNGGESK